MIGSSHLQLSKKNSCFTKLENGPLDPTKIYVEDFIFNKFVNYSCLINCTENLFQFIPVYSNFLPNGCITEQLYMLVFE